VTDLHAALRNALDLHTLAAGELITNAAPLNAALSAHRAIVEGHRPTTEGTCLPACSGCSAKDGAWWISWVAYPCGELQLIAKAFGIEVWAAALG